ncbi:conserved Plasmodium protein, unknown function [Plasmodium knowlesi strain H]|uniref:CWC16 domain-containing protein n=3 Tax=Plasmodium knowlesi TaxID=5850 RepID=A0A5K1VKM5_PLAKH|nr:CWC16 domain-containing protein, putative [Plasmodium knowlesi strain H]OTN63671.1 Uncharacterized protein PKNOH_S140270100 [Plasmodium knowlesi]CAA9991114.1 CWC16 domain-containing protein, putative [Plasmodium knowlesi strain H]SBO20575.1 conserved Plasmodium protein, unknown function [Plasmodium knowlesi strain H]SBO20968.1 conserved Plasmodium protein, unknown function [Plasmodium knowlesi strain H]VVS80588.1 CWC16 domain-containing protein, putative [Plasmodium knowlesi strain H]|eukprot:XP_002262398.1 hypothetical protein, conserved in Plasmodium species [Plasmodium knowlesi strain H]
MLSLKASRADNFYYGSVEDERTKKKKEEEKKKKNKKDYNEIKFEVPYTIICTKCKSYVYKGERFNSERRQVGFYLSTPFYSFTFTCKKCPNVIVFETNPKDCSYDIIQGARKKNEQFENVLTEQGRNNVNSIDFEKNKKKKINPFLLLEAEALRKKGREGEQANRQGAEQDTPSGERPLGSDDTSHDELPTDHSSGGELPNEEQSNGEDDPPSEEYMNDVIKQNYRRNHIMKNDFSCNSNLRKQLRDIKRAKIQELQERKRKNLFIDIVEGDPLEEVLVKKYVRYGEKLRRGRGTQGKDTQREGILASGNHSKDRPGIDPPIKRKLAKSNLIKKKKSSIFDQKYLKKGK